MPACFDYANTVCMYMRINIMLRERVRGRELGKRDEVILRRA